MSRLLTREDLSRTLAAHCAFTSAGKILDGDDKATLTHLRSLRRKLKDERGETIDRVIRNLKAIVEAEKARP
jgi:hypothetical protein